ncbi:trypsin-like peptidase domain-containing protein [Cryobacterium sp. 1639]|uniref:S1C family serine protease n=1 Tax=Cryobacterium inferilacus TaxID=2866629 RepID=UPI001C73CA83|nr:trypsin-like peptidase domain-containing protein [Cryobacterium sp. 1639]MBX0300113.1 trypsin-like peptidase domain-containing protein [Cryobacterium sp. 1639]
MTDSTQDPDKTPDQPQDTTPFEVNSSGEAAAATPDSAAAQNTTAASANTPTADHTTAVQPSVPHPADNQATEVIGSADGTVAAQPAAPQAGAPQANTPPIPVPAPAAQTQPAQPTQSYGHQQQAYATDAFGRPIPGPDGRTPIYAPTPAQQQAYANANANGYAPQPAPKAPKDPNRRRGGVALIAALAIGALVGGASGAGVTAYVVSNQSNGTPASQAEGPSTVVVNNTDSVNEITAVAAKASPSVVTIEVASADSGGTGSGVILTEDGYILTNTHVVTLDGASSDAAIEVKASDGKLYTATLVGTDPVSDLAVIKLNDASGLSPIKWADSSELNVGDTAIAIGAPLGLSGTVTNGIVSALNRSITVASSAAPTTPDETTPDENDDNYFNYDLPGTPAPQGAQSSISLSVIQTDAAINPGNSGGALLNSKGELIGINVAIANAGGDSSAATAGSIGVGFSIPANLAKRVSDEIIETGSASHGLLGASVTSASSEDSATVGALISEVSPGGAAEDAGLQAGDVVTNLNDVPITDATDLTAQVRSLAAGDTAELTYVRDGESVTVEVTVGELTS